MKSNSQQTLTKYVNIIQKLWDTYHFRQFSYEEARSLAQPFRANNSIPSYMVKMGLLIRENSLYKFTRQPILPKDAKEAHAMSKAAQKQYYARLKGAETKSAVQQNLFPINEELCIKYLKDKGYRILKPIQPQYEEL